MAHIWDVQNGMEMECLLKLFNDRRLGTAPAHRNQYDP